MRKDNKEACQNCKHWYRVEEWDMRSQAYANGKTQCRRNPPTPGYIEGESVTFWPFTYADDFCGEFTQRKEDGDG